jgi:hypothetical protein
MDSDLVRVTEPASVLVSLGALCGLAASIYWLRVVRAHYKSDESIEAPWSNDIRNAAAWSAVALGLASVGYLLGRLTGEF